MPGFHGRYDRLQGLRIVGVTGEHLIAERKAVEGHDQRDADLLAVGAVIAGIAALGLWVPFRQSFEVRARHVIEQHFVLDREQLSAALRQMRFQSSLVRQQVIKAAIEPVLVDLLVAKLQKIAERRPAIPVLGNVQLARRLAEPRRDQHRRHLRPGDALPAGRQQPLAQILKAHPAPKRQRQIDIAKPPRALDADALQANRYGHVPATVVEQLRVFRSADQTPREPACFDAAPLVKLTQMRHRLLNDPPSNSNAANQAPIAVDLPVLPARRVAQIHAANQI